MGVDILSGDKGACFYCNTTDWCFGPLMQCATEAELFLDWLKDDPRAMDDSDLISKYNEFKFEFSCAYCCAFIEDEERCYEGNDGRYCRKHKDKGKKIVWHIGTEWMDWEKQKALDHEDEVCEPETCEYCQKEKQENNR